MAHFTTLYSGSSGNCALVEEGGNYLLVDMGKSCKSTIAALQTLDLPLANLGGILVTHEHSDHVGGLAVFLKKYPVPVYGSAATLDYLSEHSMVPRDTNLIEVEGREEDVCGFGVQSFATSHDSVDCRGYRITAPSGKVVSLATDLGYVSDEVLANLLCSDLVSLEANYDYKMLMAGSYPYYLKTRIASKRGHLCNDECAATVVKLVQNGCRNITLGHISKENNTPELAQMAVAASLLASGVTPNDGVRVRPASRYNADDFIVL